MAHSGRWQPVVEQAAHPLPGKPGFLTAPPHRPIPEPTNPEAEQAESSGVRGYPVVAQVPTHNRAQPASHLRDRIVQAPPKLGLHLPQLGLQPLPHRLPEHRKPSVTPLRPAGSRSASRYRRPGCGLPHPPTASAPQSNPFRGSIPGPQVPPVNASPPPSRATAHDSGPPWIANPSTYDSSIHNTLPVCAGAQEVKMILKEPHACGVSPGEPG